MDPTVVGFSCLPRDFACPPCPPSVWGSLFFGPPGNGCLGDCSKHDSQRRKGRLWDMTPYSLECREEGPSFPPPTARKGKVSIRGLGSDLRVVTRSHRSWPTLILHRGSQARVHSRGEAVGIPGHPTLCPAGGSWASAGKRQRPIHCWEPTALG